MDELLTRGVDQIIGREELEEALKGNRKLRIKFGVDPTPPRYSHWTCRSYAQAAGAAGPGPHHYLFDR
jgi:hypothetical protein